MNDLLSWMAALLGVLLIFGPGRLLRWSLSARHALNPRYSAAGAAPAWPALGAHPGVGTAKPPHQHSL